MPIYPVAANLMQYLELDFPPKNWTDLLPYEVKGSNKSELVCAATSPEHAIDQFMDAFPGEEFYSIECRQPEKEWQRFRCGQWVATSDGDRVMLLRSRLLKDRESGAISLHYETSLGQGEWIRASEVYSTDAEVMEVLAA